MKKILITSMSALAISVTAFFSAGAIAADQQPSVPLVTNPTPDPIVTSVPTPVSVAPTNAPLTTPTVTPNPATTVTVKKEEITQNSDGKVVSVEESKKVTVKKENKEPAYQVSKGTLYSQLAYDFHKKGYKTVWGLSFDPSFTPKKYDSIEDEMLGASNRLNQVWNGNFDDGNKVLAFKCPLKREIHFVFSDYAASVVDADGVNCDLITPTSKNNGYDSDGSGSQSATNAAGSNYYETGNVLSGPMIVGSKNQ